MSSVIHIIIMYRISILAFLLITAAACHQNKRNSIQSLNQNPSPMVESTRQHIRIGEEKLPGVSFQIPDLFDRPISVYVPSDIADEGIKSLLIHFHGAGHIPNKAVYGLDGSVAAVSINLGSGSAVYERAFSDPDMLERTVDAVRQWCRNASVPIRDELNVYLSSFSAGYGAIRAILEADWNNINGLILLDGLHTGYIPEGTTLYDGGTLNKKELDVFLAFATQASEGGTKMIITHSEIFPGTYASTTETTDYLILALGLKRTPVLEWGPVGMQLLSRTEKGNLLILGFAGNTAPDHMDHLHGLPDFLKMVIPVERTSSFVHRSERIE